MDPITAKLMSAAGVAGDPVYVDDVFSTFLYDGDDGNETITNGLDLSGEGGLVWSKYREHGAHYLFDTERNADKYLQSSSTNTEKQLDFVLNSVAYGNSIYVAATDYGFYTSTNGTTWTAVTDADVAGIRYRTVKYLGSRFVAIGNHKTWATSTDGTNWTTSTISTDTAPYFNEIYYSNGRYMLKAGTSSSGSVFISTDNGATWTSSYSGASGGRLGVAGNAFVSLSSGAGLSSYYNTSGTTWTAVTPHSSGCTAIYQGDGIVFAQFGYQTWKYSNNGSNWGTMTGGSGLAFPSGFDYAPDTGKYWLVTQGFAGGTSQLGTSSNGTSWSFGTSLPNTSGNYIYVCNDGTNFMIGTTGTTYYTSSDGTASSWTSRTAPSGISATNQLLSSGAGGRAFIKETSLNKFHSNDDVTDTTTWSTVNAPTPPNLVSFSSNGFSILTSLANEANKEFVSWAFRKCPGFFDVVTYTGNGTAGRQIAHNLGSVPGMIVIKSLTSTENWTVWHRSLTSNQYVIQLDTTSAEIQAGNGAWNNTGPTSSVFTLGGDFNVNQNNQNYVAYIFAHDDQSFGDSGNEAIIKCGSYTGNDNSDGPNVNLGFEPQWILVKSADSSADWVLIDSMRGFAVNNVKDARIFPNKDDGESAFNVVEPNATGFKINTTLGAFNTLNEDYIYMAIRRPHKPPEAATEVFTPVLASSSGDYTATAGFPVDLNFYGKRSSTDKWFWRTRLTGDEYLQSQNTGGVGAGTTNTFFDSNTAFRVPGVSGNYSDYINYNFKRAPGFFDLITYTGTGSARNINHNLTVEPELVIIKSLSANGSWIVGSTAFSSGGHLVLDESGGLNNVGSTTRLVYANWSSTVLGIGADSDVNSSGTVYVAYLFATLPGISKVGTYTGTGSDVNVDCGFTNGARFVLVKKATASQDWFVLDTVRGINVGNDPSLRPNTTSAEASDYSVLEPLSSGFTADADTFSTSGETYLFLAIA
jgi:hypothetical protein|tara:strand:+ start:419 stop:3346 length:2928 start_codon:yes stop_codon:yes gene_type:complete